MVAGVVLAVVVGIGNVIVADAVVAVVYYGYGVDVVAVVDCVVSGAVDVFLDVVVLLLMSFLFAAIATDCVAVAVVVCVCCLLILVRLWFVVRVIVVVAGVVVVAVCYRCALLFL